MFSLCFVSIETPVASKSWVIGICLCRLVMQLGSNEWTCGSDVE